MTLEYESVGSYVNSTKFEDGDVKTYVIIKETKIEESYFWSLSCDSIEKTFEEDEIFCLIRI